MTGTITKQAAADFLLGRLADKERDGVEKSFIADHAVFEELLQAENELIDDYVAGRLTGQDRQMFERVVLPRTAGRISFARALATYASQDRTPVPTAKRSWAETLRIFFSLAPSYSIGMAAAALIVVGLVFWALRPAVNEVAGDLRPADSGGPQVAAPALPIVDSPATPATGDPRNEDARVQEAPVRPTERTPQKRERSTPAIIATIALAPVTRSSGSAASAVLPRKEGSVRLEFPAESGSYRLYSIRVETPEGRQVWQRRIAAKPGTIRADIPSRRLSRGDYIVTLIGIPTVGASETLNEYPLSIK